jgi:hypothetical protein
MADSPQQLDHSQPIFARAQRLRRGRGRHRHHWDEVLLDPLFEVIHGFREA